MPRVNRTCVDAGVALLLVLVLVVVYWIDHRVTRNRPDRASESPTVRAQDETLAPVPLSLAVTPAGFDDMGKLLGTLGAGYKFSVVDEKTLADSNSCARFDAIFLTCAKITDEPPSPQLIASLREFVSDGGTLYASDLRFDTLEKAFHELVDRESVAQGLSQNLRAEVVSPDLVELLGSEMPLHFDLDGWRPAAFRGEAVTVYLKGKFRTTAGIEIIAPLLVKFPFGKGNVLFTSFHNEKQNSALESKLLNHLVLSTVTARMAETVTESMVRGGFSIEKTSLLSAAPGDPSLTRTYEHTRSGGLVFTLGFEARGAKLRLEVDSPDGRHLMKDGGSTLTIDVPDAVPGTWKYTAKPDSLPYPNFPFTMSVGAAGAPKPTNVATTAPPRVAEPAPTGSIQFREVVIASVADEKPQRIGITKPNFDDVGKLLGSLGKGYQFQTIPDDDLLQPAALDKFDVVFFTCDGFPSAWAEVHPDEKEAERPGLIQSTPRADAVKACGETIGRFVRRGGTLYASDLRLYQLLWAFPERVINVNINLAPLPELQRLERDWLTAKVPTSGVGTIAETLNTVELSQALKKKLDVLVATVELSSLVGGQLDEQPADSPEEVILKSCKLFSLQLTDADVQAVAAAIVNWNQAIGAAFRTRSRAHILRDRNQILRLEDQIVTLRSQLVKDRRGAGNQAVKARILEPGLRELLGEEISLNFNATAWFPARVGGPDVVEYIKGEYQPLEGGRVEAPLLVKFKEGKGAVIFTSFHNEAQNSRQEEALLKYLVLTAVTAKEQEVADATMISGGFSPVKRSVDSHSSGNASLTRSYRSPKAGPLRFSLSFSGQGARLKLKLVAPNHQEWEKETRGNLAVEATGAPAGEWQYTVTAVQVPYENFPFSVSVGEGASSPGSKTPDR